MPRSAGLAHGALSVALGAVMLPCVLTMMLAALVPVPALLRGHPRR